MTMRLSDDPYAPAWQRFEMNEECVWLQSLDDVFNIVQMDFTEFHAFPWGGVATGCCSGHASKQAGKAVRSQGHRDRKKRSRILAALKQNRNIYRKNIRVCTQVG